MVYPGNLHSHTQYSNLRLRDAIVKEKDLINKAIELGHKVVAITEHEALGGWLKVENAADKVKDKIKVIRGNEIYLVRNGLNAGNFNKEFDRYFHFILLAADAVGARQIMEISTRAWHRSYMARGMRRVPTYYNDLAEIIGNNKGHIIGSTACLGGCLPTQLLRYRDNKDENFLGKIKTWIKQIDNIFGHGNFYFELQPSNNKDQIYVNKFLIKLAAEFDIKYIITTDTHYLTKDDRNIHKAYLNAQNGDREVDDFYATTYLMSDEELRSYFNYLTEDELEAGFAAIDEIANKCQEFSLKKPLRIPMLPWENVQQYVKNYNGAFEKMPMLKTFYESESQADRYLVDAILDGIAKHEDLQNDEAYNEINECLKMTWISSEKNKASWSSYYLNLQKIIDECWDAGTIVGCGRGSGVGFILLYVLDITQINPLKETTKTYRWRFLNPDRVSVLDVDVDIEGTKRKQVLNHLREVYGEDKVANVATYKTETTKSAILTAARGIGLDVDIARYISSLVPSDRGQIRSLDECFYGDEEKGFKPIKQFVFEMTENHPELWEVAHKIEGLICGYGMHAGGVIFVDEPFTNSTALMRAPDNTICTQFELHDCEAASLIKYDVLSVEAMDKIHNCIDLLCEFNYAETKSTLRETYENIVGIYKLERTDPKMWEMVWNHEIQSLFQMEKQSGISGISLVHPESVDDLATLNSVIRLMAQQKGAEQPLNKFARFKKNIDLWYQEMAEYGLTAEEMKLLEPVVKLSYGMCESQEGFMQLVQMPECGGFDLTWADRLRKSIAKKNPAEYEKLQDEYFKQVQEKGLSMKLCNYVWNVLVATSRGYGFNKSHTLAYSLIALQEMNLAYKYPIVFWNCACLINDSGGNEEIEEEDELMQAEPLEEYYNEMEEFGEDDKDEDIVNSYNEDEDCDGYPVEVVELKSGKKKKKTRTTAYGKIAAAMGKMKTAGVAITAPDINKSSFTFTPDVENNAILHGLSGITRVSVDLIKEIIANRPYTSLADFRSKVKINKLEGVNLIKSGIFDSFGDRKDIMTEYIDSICDKKKRMTLQNLNMLIDFGLIPDEFDMERRVYKFNKYLRKMKIGDSEFGMDNIAFNFYNKYFDMDLLLPANTESGFKINKIKWDNIYQKYMDNIRPFVKANNEELLTAVNKKLFDDEWHKYCEGNLAAWEMASICCYISNHELEKVNQKYYHCEDYELMPDNPEIDRVIFIKGKQVPLFKIKRIMGTILDKDKNKNLITLLTTTGVVTVRIFGDVFTHYDKQLSKIGADGRKHVIEKSWLSRGNKIIVTGIKQNDCFVGKKYSATPWHFMELITDIDEEGNLITKGERKE